MTRRRSSCGQSAEVGRKRPPASVDGTRRTVLRTIGSAGLLAGSGLPVATSGVLADEPVWEPETWNVDEYEFESGGLDSSTLSGPDGPVGVFFEDDRVVVRDSHTFPETGCDTFVLTRLAYDEELNRLGAHVTHLTGWEYFDEDPGEWACLHALGTVRYELVVPFEDGPPDSLVLAGEIDGEFGSATYYREPPVDPPEGVEYKLSLGDAATSPDAAEADPHVTFVEDALRIEGVLSLPSGCQTVAVDRLAYAADNERLEVDLVDAIDESYFPGEPCPGEHVGRRYELLVTFSESVPDGATVTERDPEGERRVTVDRETVRVGEYDSRDLDGDGLYADVDGTGHLGSNDVVVFFEHLEEQAVADGTAAFDFNGSGDVGFDDVVALFELV